MREVRPGWKRGAVFVCANQRPSDATKPSCGEEAGRSLRAWLKARVRDEGLKGSILTSNTGCLGICPRKGVVVAIVPEPGAGARKVLVVDPEADREALWREVRRTILGAET